MNNNRTYGTMVHLLDTDKLNKLLFDLTGDESVKAQRMALVMDADEKFYTLCTEGVGWGVNSDGEMVILSSMFDDYEFATEDVIDCISDETEDLADFIRTFGARLDSNFYQWQNRIGDTPQTINRNYSFENTYGLHAPLAK